MGANNGYSRARAAQILCALAAKSDPEERVLEDFLKIWAVTYDDQSATARHALQAIWKIGQAGQVQRDLVVSYFCLLVFLSAPYRFFIRNDDANSN